LSQVLKASINLCCDEKKPERNEKAQLLALKFELDRITGNGVTYSCDFCRTAIAPGAVRWHCLECDDFDMCEPCHTAGKTAPPHISSHRVTRLACKRISAGSDEPRSDPLVDELLGPATQPTTSDSPAASNADRTIVTAILRLTRFQLALGTWWALIQTSSGLKKRAQHLPSFESHSGTQLIPMNTLLQMNSKSVGLFDAARITQFTQFSASVVSALSRLVESNEL
jgi:hypothetical protein